MLEIDGRPPKLINQLCEELFCQQYWSRGKLIQEVDILLLKINQRWHQLYFDAGIVFWRLQRDTPVPVEPRPDAAFTYPLINLGIKYGLRDSFILDCLTEPLVDGARVTMVFEEKGSLLITHSENKTRLQFNKL
ncbi:MAG: hypothetical protein PVG75_09550 [Thioalkalispiraceae bacterium]|jgi:hypothetical protein